MWTTLTFGKTHGSEEVIEPFCSKWTTWWIGGHVCLWTYRHYVEFLEEWDCPRYFNERDNQLILAMSIHSIEHDEDTIIWKVSKEGKYSVKSTYFLVMKNLVNNASLRVPGDWITVWNLNIPQKIKTFSLQNTEKLSSLKRKTFYKGCPMSYSMPFVQLKSRVYMACLLWLHPCTWGLVFLLDLVAPSN